MAGHAPIDADTAPTTPGAWPSAPGGLPDLSRDPWGEGTATPAPALQSIPDAFVARPSIDTTFKLPAITDVHARAWKPWVIAAILVVAALLGGIALKSVLRDPEPKARLEILSRPAGATVLLDGRPLAGVTPLGVGTPIPGLVVGQRYEMEVRLEGHEVWRGDVTPIDGPLQKVAVLVPLRRDVIFESVPPGGQIWIDGVLHGALPRRLEGVRFGRALAVRVTWPSGPALEQEVVVDADTPDRLEVVQPAP